MLRALRVSFEQDRLFIVDQPQVTLAATGAATGVEVLIRWKTEDGRYAPPSQFIPRRQTLGLIVKIGDGRFGSAAASWSAWTRKWVPGCAWR